MRIISVLNVIPFNKILLFQFYSGSAIIFVLSFVFIHENITGSLLKWVVAPQPTEVPEWALQNA